MTEKEVIDDLGYLIEEYSAYPPETGVCGAIGSLQSAIKALEEIQQYREIGTVEECREAMSRYRQRKKMVKCEECLFLEERKSGRSGAIIGVCRIKPQNGRRYGKSCACRFFEKDYKDLEGMEDE